MQGLTMLFCYLVFMLLITFAFTKKSVSKSDFFIGNRRMGALRVGLSIAVTWIWAPSLFTSAEKAYSNGWVGLFWFLVPNVLCLLTFIPFAKRIRDLMPEGITLSGYMNSKYGTRVKNIYLLELIGLALMSTTVQLLAGGKILSSNIGLPYWLVTILLGAIAYSYSRYSGFKASVVTDVAQMIIILVACVTIVTLTVNGSGGSALVNGLNGISGGYKSLFDVKGIEVFLAFGLSGTIGLLSGPFGDQTFWQRAFAVKKEKIGRAFVIAATIFVLVPLSMASIGFMAAGSGFIPKDTGMVNFEYVSSLLPQWAILLFILMILSGLLSTIDSNLCAVPALADDMIKNFNLKDSKLTMIILLAVAIAISNIPGLTVTHLFLFYGTLRASTLLTTVLTLLDVKLHEKGVFYGVLASLTIGLPVYAFGAITNQYAFRIAGSLLSVLLSGIVALIFSAWRWSHESR